MPRRNALSSEKLGLERGYQQKNLTKLPGLSDLASLNHKHLSTRMSVYPQKMNSLRVAGALSEFFRERLYSMSIDELAQCRMLT